MKNNLAEKLLMSAKVHVKKKKLDRFFRNKLYILSFEIQIEWEVQKYRLLRA